MNNGIQFERYCLLNDYFSKLDLELENGNPDYYNSNENRITMDELYEKYFEIQDEKLSGNPSVAKELINKLLFFEYKPVNDFQKKYFKMYIQMLKDLKVMECIPASQILEEDFEEEPEEEYKKGSSAPIIPQEELEMMIEQFEKEKKASAYIKPSYFSIEEKDMLKERIKEFWGFKNPRQE